MTDVEWVDPPPVAYRGRQTVYDRAILDVLREHPGRWAKVPPADDGVTVEQMRNAAKYLRKKGYLAQFHDGALVACWPEP